MITAGTQYTLSLHRLACPRAKYTNDYYRSRYLFIGMLVNEDAEIYAETALLYPEQNIKSIIEGILTISDITITTASLPTFSSIYATFFFQCNIDIQANS